MFQHISGFAETAFILLMTNYNYSKERKRKEKKMKEGEVKRKDRVYDAVDTLWMSSLTWTEIIQLLLSWIQSVWSVSIRIKRLHYINYTGLNLLSICLANLQKTVFIHVKMDLYQIWFYIKTGRPRWDSVRCVNILTYYCNNNITVSAAEICSAFLHTHTYKTEPCHKINRCCELSSVSL